MMCVIQCTKKKKKLKVKSFLITESLTAARLALLKEVQDKCGERNVSNTNLRKESNRAFLYQK